MSPLHFLNCALLTFGPPWVLHKSLLAEHDARRPMALGAAAFAAALGLKMLLLATFSVSLPGAGSGAVDVLQEVFLAALGVVDALALHYLLTRTAFVGDKWVRVVGVGLGWSTAESAALRLVPLWLGANGPDFSWGHLQSALEANLSLAVTVAFTAAVYIARRPPKRPASAPAFPLLVAARCALPAVLAVVRAACGFGAGVLLLLHAALALPYCAVARHRFLLQK